MAAKGWIKYKLSRLQYSHNSTHKKHIVQEMSYRLLIMCSSEANERSQSPVADGLAYMRPIWALSAMYSAAAAAVSVFCFIGLYSFSLRRSLF